MSPSASIARAGAITEYVLPSAEKTYCEHKLENEKLLNNKIPSDKFQNYKVLSSVINSLITNSNT